MTITPQLLDAYSGALEHDLKLFAPELLVAGSIVLVLFLKLFSSFARTHINYLAGAPVFVALLLVVMQWNEVLQGTIPGTAFTGLLMLDPFSLFIRGLLLIFVLLALFLGRETGIPDGDDSADYCVLLLGGTLGMMLMASANHLMMVFIAMEMASLPCYGLAGFLKGRRTGSEAALKYVLYGAAASGTALYGISLLMAKLGTATLPGVASGIASSLKTGFDPMVVAGLIFLLAGFAFKLSVVPFHFWCPDVFEGAAAEVGAFLSIASKAAAVALTARVLLAIQAKTVMYDPLILQKSLGIGIMIVAAITVTLGNLAALNQTNLKRMLAYSTIAHAGVMLMGLSTLTTNGVSAVLYYLAAYLPTNLIAFVVIAAVRNRTGAETVDSVRGLMTRSPALAIGLVIGMLSLLGLPPLAGFAGKFQVFEAVYEAGRVSGDSQMSMAFNILLGVGVLNTVISAGYYLKVVRVAVLDDPTSDQPLSEPAALSVLIGALAFAVVLIGILWNPIIRITTLAVRMP